MTNALRTLWPRLPIAAGTVALLGCPDGPPGGEGDTGTTGGAETGTAGTTTGTTGTTAETGVDETTTGGGEGTIDCPDVKDPLPAGTFPNVSEPETIPIAVDGLCEDVIGMLPGETVLIELRHPAISPDGTWPDERLPLLIFTHGAQQTYTGYEHLLPLLAAEGFIIADRKHKAPSHGAQQKRAALRWFPWSILSATLVVGHTRPARVAADCEAARGQCAGPGRALWT
jgi:hypothetical protein